MKLPRRRGSRTHGRARLALTGDFDGDGRDIADAIAAAAPAPWDGTTVPLSGLRGQPRFTPAPAAVIPPGVKAVKQYGRNTHPLAFGARPAVPPPPARPALTAAAGTPAEAALTSIQLRVRALALKGQLDRVSDAKLHDVAARRRDRLRQPRTTAKVIIDEALDLLRAGREPWHPDGAA